MTCAYKDAGTPVRTKTTAIGNASNEKKEGASRDASELGPARTGTWVE